MTRFAPIILLFSLVACSNNSSLDHSHNLVCERVKVENSKAECIPEFTNVGDQHIHTARVTVDMGPDKGSVTVACALSMSMVSMACGDLVAQPQRPGQPPPQTQQALPPAPVPFSPDKK